MGNNCNNRRSLLALQVILIPLAVVFISLTWARNAQSSSPSLITSDNPVPVLTAIDPAEVIAGSDAFTLTLTGSSFITQSVVRMDTAPLTTTFISTTQLLAAVPAENITTYGQAQIQVYNPPPQGGLSDSLPLIILPHSQIFLPIVFDQFPVLAGTPVLDPIANADYDNRYTVSWKNPGGGNNYVLEESLDPAFTQPVAVYQGPNLSWTVPAEGKLPGTYYYRARTVTASGNSPWSNVQALRIYPLFVGLRVRFDGVGYIRGLDNYDVGWHETLAVDTLTDADTVRALFHAWYDPDPLGFGQGDMTEYYSVTTGVLISSSLPDDPNLKWEYSWKLDYDATFTDGSTVQINGQNFTVRGPKAGTTSYGKPISYWEFVNQNQILYYDLGDLKQYIQPGQAILRYDAGSSRLLLHEDVTRRLYYLGEDLGESVQYVVDVTAANSLPGSPPVVQGTGRVEATPGESLPLYKSVPVYALARQPMFTP
ncbi:MAG: IPT/TIG domain-containing protein [Anaerolineales bacterium]